MIETLELGSSPSDENCVQVSKTEDYIPAMREELKRYKALLEKLFPINEDLRVWFGIKWYSHEFGKYGEVVINFDDNDEEASDFAYFVEDNLPERWK